MSAAATPAAGSRPSRNLRLLARAVLYELRKVSAFRTGFLVQEVLRGVARPIVLLFLFHAVYAQRGGQAIAGLDPLDTVHYLLFVALLDKLVFHDRALDLSLQIFEGYVTKFLVMPFEYFVLPLGRWVQYVLLQAAVVPVLWIAGALAFPAWWPEPTSAAALLEALVLVVLGSYCHLLLYFVLHSLAFWLDVVWSLLVMARFVTLFVAGAVLPAPMMPEGVVAGLSWLFPYWTIAGPAQILMGRLSHADFARGAGVLIASALALELLRRVVWRRGVRRYAGSGM